MTDFDVPDEEHPKELQLGVELEEIDDDPEYLSEDAWDDVWAEACTVEEAKEWLDALAGK
jgi:hypothetical protein